MIEKTMNKLKKNKNEIICGIVIFLVQCIILIPWLKGHMSGDDYTIANIGYKEYIKNFSLNDGRIFAGWMIALYSFLNINIEISAIISLVISLIICSISVVYLKKMIEDIQPKKNLFSEIIVTIISFVTIFNFMNIDCLYFIESPVIEGSILMVLIAVNTLSNEQKYYNIKTLVLIIWAVFIYQATVFIAIPIIALFSIIKYRDRGRIKKIIINFAKICVFVLIGLVANILFIKLYNTITGLHTARAGINLDRMYAWAMILLNNIEYIVYTNFNYFVSYALLIIIFITSFVLLIYTVKKKKKISLIIYFFATEFLFFICNEVVFIITNSSLGSGRMNLCMGMIIGAGLIYIYTLTDMFEENNFFKIIMTAITIIYFGLTIYKSEEIIITVAHVHELDKKMAREICTYIENYENEHNVKVTQINELMMKSQLNKVFYKETQEQNVLYRSIIKTSRDSSALVNYYKKDKIKIKQIFSPEIVEDDIKYYCEGNILYLVVFQC